MPAEKSKNFISSNPYQSVAEFYDKMMMHVNYSEWATFIFNIIYKHELPHSPVLEIGCGTGIFAQKFALETFGLDNNLNMLREYKNKNAASRLICDSIPHLNSLANNSFSGIIMLYDTINYLLKPEEWHIFFKRANEILHPGGWMIFDVVTQYCCETYFQNDTYIENYENGKFIRKIKYDAEKKIQHNHFYIYRKDGNFYEHHQQLVPSVSWIIDIFTAHSFEIIAVYDDMTTQKVDSESLRAHFIIKKIVTT